MSETIGNLMITTTLAYCGSPIVNWMIQADGNYDARLGTTILGTNSCLLNCLLFMKKTDIELSRYFWWCSSVKHIKVLLY